MNGTHELAAYEGIDGGKLIMWMSHHAMIAKFIEKHNLIAVPHEHLPGSQMRVPSERLEASADLPFKPYPFPGGIRVPHLHFKGEIYLLNRKQWKEFAGDTIKGFHEKLERANNVTFDQLMEVSEAVSTFT
jgi:hypothetical protein